MALLVIASSADAKLLVVMPSEHGMAKEPFKALRSDVLYTLDLLGVDYDVVAPGTAKTEFCRTGVMTYNFGSAGAYTVAYDAVLHGSWKVTNLRNSGGYTPDSLTLSWNASSGEAMKLLVPQLFVGIHGNFLTATTCSTGNKTQSTNLTTAWGSTRYLEGSDLRWRAAGDEYELVTTAATPGGGVRMLVSERINVATHQSGSGVAITIRTNCVDCDSIYGPQGFVAGQDSGYVWMALKSHIQDSKPIIYVTNQQVGALEGPAWLGALAALDSAAGGGVFRTATRIPLRIGIQVRGGWRRGGRAVAGGISPDDSTNLKAAIDSLLFLRVPFAVGVNVDSLSFYTDDRNWWNRAAPYVHYAPEQWGGVIPGDRTGKSTAASWQRPLDPFGATRARITYGDGSCLGADTSVWCLERANFYKLDSAFTKPIVDHVPMAAGFDWVPAGSKPDSLIAFMSQAGAIGMVTNGYSLVPSTLSRNSREWNILYGRSAGSPFRLLATPSYYDSGSAHFNGNNIQPGNEGYKASKHIDLWWTSLLRGRHAFAEQGDPATWPGVQDSTEYLWDIRPRILTIHASDLGSGIRTDWATRPAIPGWWIVKSIVNGARAVNRLAGRTIISIEYPEDVTP